MVSFKFPVTIRSIVTCAARPSLHVASKAAGLTRGRCTSGRSSGQAAYTHLPSERRDGLNGRQPR